MIGVEVPALDFAIESRFFAVFFGLVVLLSLVEEPMCGVVMDGIAGRFFSVLLDLARCPVT